MFSFVCFRDWIHQVIQTILIKFLTFIFTPFSFVAIPTTDSIIPDEIITEILLRLPPKSLSKFMCVSKSWNQLISSTYFVKSHLKLNSHHRVLYPGWNGNFKVCSLSDLFNKQQPVEELFDVDCPTSSAVVVGSANGLICLFNGRETYIWNPTISKSKKLLNSTWGSFRSRTCGFGYDEPHDDYKALFIGCCRNSSRHVVNIYSLRADTWTTVYEQFQGFSLINRKGKFVNGKLYWASSTGINKRIVCNIISFDLAHETWGSVALPFCGEDKSNFKLGITGSDLSLIYTCYPGATTSDVWILKDCGLWTKLFTIKYPQPAGLYQFPSPIYTFSMHFRESNKGDILLLYIPFIMIFDGSTRKLEHNADAKREEIYLESLVNPLTISDQGRL